VTKPSDWIPGRGEIRFVSYCVDGMNGIRVEVQDSLGVVNAPSSFSFSFNLAGLKDGEHTVDVSAEGMYEDTEFLTTFQKISFTVYTPFPTTLVLASVSVLAIGGIGLFVYFKKRNRTRINKHSEVEQPST
jgi:hypothetical protein